MSDSNDKKWFEKLRVNSWEVEILIVAVILAFLFNAPDFISDRLIALEVSNHNDGRGYDPTDPVPFWLLLGIIKMFLYQLLQVCFIVAKITFCSYVFFRGFWVAAIGLSSVFSKGVNVKRLNYSSHFNKLLPKDSFDNFILGLDNICSSIFSVGFLIAFYVSSILIYLCFVVLILGSTEYLLDFINISDNIFNFIFIGFLVTGIIFFLDIFFLGILKKVKWKAFSYLYSKLYKFLRIITLFFIYESVYYLFISNIKRRSIFILWLIFVLFITATILSNKSDGYLAFPSDTLKTNSFMSQNHYEDRLLASGENFSFTMYPFISSEIISESFLKLYVPFHPIIHSSIDSACGIVNSDKGSSYYQSLINCINSQYAIYIDNDTVVSDFVFYDYFSNDISIKTFFMPISVKNYQEGKHIIRIEKLFYEYYDFIEDSADQSGWFFEEDIETKLVKGSDSLIHIPFYIYR
jgi:hypothetical protein